MTNVYAKPLTDENGVQYSIIFEQGKFSNPIIVLDYIESECLLYHLFDSLPEKVQHKVIKQFTNSK